MRYLKPYTLIFMLIVGGMNLLAQEKSSRNYFQWSELPAVPDKHGFAGAFAGVSNNCLLLAGGANFPDGGITGGGAKKWHQKIYVLEGPTGKWKKVGKLERPLGYGVSVDYDGALICIGGGNEQVHSANVFLLRYKKGIIEEKTLPDLPKPLANACGALLGDKLYVCGGTVGPDVFEAVNDLYVLDLKAPGNELKWKTLDPLPGVGRMLAVAGARDGAFYVFSGVSLKKNAVGEIQRTYLQDTYRYIPTKGWERRASSPVPVAAAPGPAYPAGESLLLVFGGDDGALATNTESLGSVHPGFSNQVLAYNTVTDAWSSVDTISTASNSSFPVTTTAVLWRGNIVIPNGETQPGERTPGVIVACPIKVPLQ
ncbi:galactose oxidase [Olivibacter sp. SDN3]|uniref:galactose oxidase n=1 Tax=Olivibacter sp. SDN3 TaxID=2764720 RepID=UPI001650FF49|nr:galactose oxidase [Olivibacter sp. SDN3]QNL48284.1 galactose oxidase [Olivibacter sp. SDN3]